MLRFLSDFEDADLLVRPVPNANHAAWQLGHLILAERFHITTQLPDATYPEFPDGFQAAHAKEQAASDNPSDFLSKAQYLDLFNQVRESTLAVVDGLNEADLERATVGGLASYAPNLAEVLLVVSEHTLMHMAQFTVIRRALGKPVLF